MTYSPRHRANAQEQAEIARTRRPTPLYYQPKHRKQVSQSSLVG